jgi:Ribbon-helix-helix protein, copG family
MARMTRTQVTIEEQEYRFLKAQAAESGASLSAVVRELVRERMRQEAAAAPHVWEVAGLVTESDITGRDHDAVLYGHPSGADTRDAKLGGKPRGKAE